MEARSGVTKISCQSPSCQQAAEGPRLGRGLVVSPSAVGVAALSHDLVLSLAREACRAASEGDPGRLTETLGALLAALELHLRAEAPLLTRLTPPEERMLRRGQARVLRSVGELLDASDSCGGSSQECSALLGELRALLGLQTDDEELALGGAFPGTPLHRRYAT